MHRLIEENLWFITWFARRVCRSHAEDVAQQACLSMLKASVPPTHSVSQWIRLKVLDARRTLMCTNQREVPIGVDFEQGAGSLQANQEHVAELSLLRDRIGDLPPPQQRAMGLLMSGYDMSEAGEVLGVSKQAVRKQVLLARETLRLAA